MSFVFPVPPEKICLLRLSAIGDVSHILPALRIIQKNWPTTHITWIVGRTEHVLVGDIDNVDFIVYDKARGVRALTDLRRRLRGLSFDLLLNMQVSPRAALAAFLVNAPIKLGFDRQRGKLLHNLSGNRRIPYSEKQHVLDSFLEFPRALGLQVADIRWDIQIPETAVEKTAEFIPKDVPFVVINPCSSVRARNYRNWSVASYAAVIDHVATRYGLQTVLTGGPSSEEKKYAMAIARQAGTAPVNLVGLTGLKDLLAVLQRAILVIAPDTGPAHLANAVGTPVIGLYATSNPLRTGPYCHRDLTVNCYPEALMAETGKTVDQVRWGKRVRNPAAMELITTDMVIEKIDHYLCSRSNTPDDHQFPPDS